MSGDGIGWLDSATGSRAGPKVAEQSRDQLLGTLCPRTMHRERPVEVVARAGRSVNRDDVLDLEAQLAELRGKLLRILAARRRLSVREVKQVALDEYALLGQIAD